MEHLNVAEEVGEVDDYIANSPRISVSMRSTNDTSGPNGAIAPSPPPPPAPPPPASQHSYFSGASHPLQSANRSVVSSHWDPTNNNNSATSTSELFDLVIIELPGVVLLPGMTIPLRLDEPGSIASSPAFWMLYRQIQESRRAPGQAATVQIGILTKLDPGDRPPRPEEEPRDYSQTTTSILMTTEGTGGDHHHHNQENHGNSNSTALRRRRSSWMRRTFGPERLGRFSQQIIQEMANIQVVLENVESADQVMVDVRQPPPPRLLESRQRRSSASRRRHLLIRLEQAAASDYDEDDADNDQERLSEGEVAFLHRRRNASRNAENSSGGTANDEESAINTGTTTTTVLRRPTTTSQRNNDPYADRIGTLATVTCTHGDDDQVVGRINDDSMVYNNHHNNNDNNNEPRPRASLNLTAVGTGRFRILPYDPKDSNTAMAASAHRHNTTDDPFRPLFWKILVRLVREYSHERIPASFPSPFVPEQPRKRPAEMLQQLPTTSRSRRPRYRATAAASLASVSVWPSFVYDTYWPWTLMQDLQQRIGAISSLHEILSSQAETIPSHPLPFSYWLALNLPLSTRERLHILHCPTVTERLRWFQRHSLFDVELRQDDDDASARTTGTNNIHPPQELEQPQQQEQQLPPPHDPSDFKDFTCKCCQIPIASARSLFAVGGAEGTLGNYVSPHGVVHSTITVRDVDLQEVDFTSQPETADSWFPGYAWTIMRCALCFSHLGWKYTRTTTNNDTLPVSSLRPACFYGLSSSCVLLTTNLRRQRRALMASRPNSNDTAATSHRVQPSPSPRQRSDTEGSTA